MRPFTVRWKNFHGFRDTKPLRIAPLTVLLGPNNSGKSSLFAPLLLMKQSVESMHAEPTLLTRGELVNAGGYRDLAHGGRSDLPITFEVRFNRQVEPDDEACDSPFHYPPTGLRVTFVADQRTDEATLAQYQVFNVWDQLMVSRRLTKSGRYSVAGVKFSDDSPASGQSPVRWWESRVWSSMCSALE